MDGRVAQLGERIDPDRALVEIDGVPLPVRPDLVYYLLNKPSGASSGTHTLRHSHTHCVAQFTAIMNSRVCHCLLRCVWLTRIGIRGQEVFQHHFT